MFKSHHVLRVIELKNGTQLEIKLPAIKIVCPNCDGTGKHVNPSIDAHGLSGAELADDDFMESYFRGDYDVTCEGCEGERVSLVHVPKLVDVLDCLFLDSQAHDEPFEEWCASLGYDTDSMKAKKIYDDCIESYFKLRKALGKDFDTIKKDIEALEL